MKEDTPHSLKQVISWILGLAFMGSIIFIIIDTPKIHTEDYASMTGMNAYVHLTLHINNKNIPIPSGVGLIPTENPIHVHGKDNIIHLEFGGRVKNDDIRLGNFFALWGKDFSATSLLGNNTGNGHTITMHVNGIPSNEFERYVMHDKDQIEIVYR